MISAASTVDEYLAELPVDRRVAIQAIREVILANLGEGFEEGMQYGMIGYYVPHSLYPAGYHCDPRQPLGFVALASQKNYLSVYLSCLYGDCPQTQEFRKRLAQTGKKLDIGKSCIRVKKLEDLPLNLIGESIARTSVKAHIASYEAALRDRPQSRKSSTVRRNTDT